MNDIICNLCWFSFLALCSFDDISQALTIKVQLYIRNISLK